MNRIGVVCEYNPFHRGHLLHLEQSRAELGENAPAICVMSGDFVQRGEAAVYSKFARAEAACRCGADLVVELPLPWCLSSAEGFARGAVSLLAGLGATHLCFGSETGELEPLDTLARALLEPGLNREIKELLAQDGSLSYAAARQRAAEARLGNTAALLSQPNNILGVEYLKALYDLRLDLDPLAIPRQGSGHDSAPNGPGPLSASELRRRIARGLDTAGEIPDPAAPVFARERAQGREVADRGVYEMALLSRLRLFDEEYYRGLPDAADGLGNRLYRAVHTEATLDAVLAAAKTKRYALARIRRLCLCAALGVTAGMSRALPPYARVLAANARGRELLREQGTLGTVPLLTKPASVRELSPESAALFQLGADAHDFYVLGYPSPQERKPGTDWRTGPRIVNHA